MATPFAAGTAALVLAHLAAQDYKYFNRGAEVRDIMRAIAPAAKGLADTGAVVWGKDFAPNGVIDWAAACKQLSSNGSSSTQAAPQSLSSDKLIEGTLDAKSGASEPGSDFPRSAAQAYAKGAVLGLRHGAGSADPDAVAAGIGSASDVDLELFFPGPVNFPPAVGGAHLDLRLSRAPSACCQHRLLAFRHDMLFLYHMIANAYMLRKGQMVAV